MNSNNVVFKQRFVWSLTKHQNPPVVTGITSKNVSQVDTRFHQSRFIINKRKRNFLVLRSTSTPMQVWLWLFLFWMNEFIASTMSVIEWYNPGQNSSNLLFSIIRRPATRIFLPLLSGTLRDTKSLILRPPIDLLSWLVREGSSWKNSKYYSETIRRMHLRPSLLWRNPFSNDSNHFFLVELSMYNQIMIVFYSACRRFSASKGNNLKNFFCKLRFITFSEG